jgi:hypothetical protein
MRAIRAEQLGNVAQHFSNRASGVADRDAGSGDASGRVVAMTPVRAKAVTGSDALTPVRSKTVTRADAMTRGSRHPVRECVGQTHTIVATGADSAQTDAEFSKRVTGASLASESCGGLGA